MDELLGLSELAREAGVKDRTLSGYLARGQCPQPDYRLACGPVWRRETVQPWIDRRDSRLSGIVETVDARHDQEVAQLAGYVYQHIASKAETARRNVHNGKLRKQRERTGHETAVRRGVGVLPTLREESRTTAARMLAAGDRQFLELDERELQRRDWAARIMEIRQANRVGTADGIPW